MIIETKRTYLRFFKHSDLNDISNVLGHPKVMRYSTLGVQSKIDCEKFIHWCSEQYLQFKTGLYAIELKDVEKVIGYCGIHFEEIDGNIQPELSYRIHPDYWNKGIGSEVASSIKNYAFEELGMNRIISVIESENVGSIRVAEKVGMKFEKDTVYKGKVSAKLYSIMNPEILYNV